MAIATEATEPEWCIQVTTYLESTSELLQLTYAGANQLAEAKDIVDYLNSWNATKLSEEEMHSRAKQAERHQDIARKAVDSDFSLLHAHTVVGAWGALEAALEDLTAGRIERDQALLQRPAYAKIQLPVATYSSVTPRRRAELIVAALQAQLKADFSMGVGQFEKLLKEVGLGGDVPDKIRRHLLFTQQYRHLVAHRGGRADTKFLQAWPNGGYVEGEEVRLSSKDMQDVLMALVGYVIVVRNREKVDEGDPVGESRGLRIWLELPD